MHGVDDEDVTVVELVPADFRQLPNDGLPFALHDEQLWRLLVRHDVQAGGNASVENPEKIVFKSGRPMPDSFCLFYLFL